MSQANRFECPYCGAPLTSVQAAPSVTMGAAVGNLLTHERQLTATSVYTIVDDTGEGGLYTSLAVINGIPAIAYCDNISHDLKYVEAMDGNGATWGAPLVVDSGQFDSYSSLADVNGLPGIAYEDSSGIGSLRFTIPVVTRFRTYLPIVMK